MASFDAYTLALAKAPRSSTSVARSFERLFDEGDVWSIDLPAPPLSQTNGTVRWGFASDAPLFVSVASTPELTMSALQTGWMAPKEWRRITLRSPTACNVYLQLESSNVDEECLNLVLTRATVTLDELVKTRGQLTAESPDSHRQGEPDTLAIAALPPASGKTSNPKRLAKFDKSYFDDQFKMTSPDGRSVHVSGELFSRRWLPVLSLGQCEDAAPHSLELPGYPGWTFQRVALD